ncbi:MAG: tetratricopeptide repeat protein [Candidatus Sungbacteria bacterium]|uniref:Tetratricopeptide repeat protein n=1 Tax=Candidatus Sungiibacteriota bacterium TaxID=2750080 RepID=A0A932YVB1_9BACT|nr:tetratricopeptide repeat protein [Candidatus Sungbacteria bacterium]
MLRKSLDVIASVSTAGGSSVSPLRTGALAESATAGAGHFSIWSERIIKGFLFGLLFLVPLIWLPFTPNGLFIKVALVEVVAVVIIAAWLANALLTKTIRYRRAPFNLLFLSIGAVLLAAAVFSATPWTSFWGDDPTGEKTATIFSFMVISLAIAYFFRRRDAKRAVNILLVSWSVLSAYVFLSIINSRFFSRFLPWFDINPVGTVNALSAFLAVGFLFALGLLLVRSYGASEEGMRATRRLAFVTLILVLPSLLLTAFWVALVAIAAALAILIALNFSCSWPSAGRDGHHAFGGRAVGVVFLVIAVSSLLAFTRPTFFSRLYSSPLEVSPSFASTLAIGRKALGESPVLGFGPANFRVAYNRFRAGSINDTPFWTTRFGHGFSFLATVPSTLGVLGIAVFLGFVASVFVFIGRVLWAAPGPDPLRWAPAGATLLILILWFIYASNFNASFALFAMLGLLVALTEREASPSGGEIGGLHGRLRRWFEVRERVIAVSHPALTFAVSLVGVFVIALSTVALYSFVAQYASHIYFQRARRVLNLYGNTDTARVFLERAVRLNSTDEFLYQSQAQVAVLDLNRIIGQAAANPDRDVSAQFRDEFARGVNAAQRAVKLAPANPQNWFILGQLYETAMPFVAGASQAALEAYGRAGREDPVTPVTQTAKARVLLTTAELASLQASRTSGAEREQLDVVYKGSLTQARAELEKALALKSDFADAHFLLTQISTREGKVSEAIRNAEVTAALAPQDIGVAFQLGMLHYRNNEFERARAVFERAIGLNENYSNARYFLGLIYDRQGNRPAALGQFKKIAALNPENDEVKRIVANLEAGRPALTGIAPPAPAPEQRKEAPVTETEKRR